MKVKILVTWSSLTLCDPLNWGLPGSSVHGIFQARIGEWVAITLSRGLFWPRDWTQVSHIADRLLSESPGKPQFLPERYLETSCCVTSIPCTDVSQCIFSQHILFLFICWTPVLNWPYKRLKWCLFVYHWHTAGTRVYYISLNWIWVALFGLITHLHSLPSSLLLLGWNHASLNREYRVPPT